MRIYSPVQVCPERPAQRIRTQRARLSAFIRGSFGFTLIEAILALGIFSIVLVAIVTVFFSAVKLRERSSATVSEAAPLNHAISILRRDLQNAVMPGGVLAGDFRSGGVLGSGNSSSSSSASSLSSSFNSSSSSGSGQPTPSSMSTTAQNGGLDFFTTTGTMSDDLPWGDIQEVNYILMDPVGGTNAVGRELVRSVTRGLLAQAAQQPEVQRLAGGIESLDFYYFDGMQWRDSWDTSAGDTGLPSAVRIRLLQATDPASGNLRPEPLEWVVLLPAYQASTNQTQTATGGLP